MSSALRRTVTSALLGATTLVAVGAPSAVQAQEPPPIPPEADGVVDPIGSDACATAGFGSVIFVAVLVEGGLDPSAGDPVTEVVGETCGSFSPPEDTVVCPADDELQNQIFALPAQEVAPLPPPPVTIFGASIETLRALAALADQSPDTVDPVAALLECTTIPGRSGTPGTPPPRSPPASSTTIPPTTVTTPSAAAPAPASTVSPRPTTPTETAAGQAPTVPSPASFTPFAPDVPPAAQLLAVLAALALLATSRWAWRRAGTHAVDAVTRTR